MGRGTPRQSRFALDQLIPIVDHAWRQIEWGIQQIIYWMSLPSESLTDASTPGGCANFSTFSFNPLYVTQNFRQGL